MTRFTRRGRCVGLGLLWGMVLSSAPQIAAAVPLGQVGDTQGNTCVLNMDTGAYTCFASIKAMVMARTQSKVTDVTTLEQLISPETVARLDAVAGEIGASLRRLSSTRCCTTGRT